MKEREIKKGQRVLDVNIKQLEGGDSKVKLSINVGPNYKVGYDFKGVDDALRFVDCFRNMLLKAKYGKDYKETK